MASRGVVRVWHADAGWGVIDSVDTPGGCWAHFSAAAVAGYVSFQAGDEVDFAWEPADQDGFRFRAVRVGAETEAGQDHPGNTSVAYTSTLTLYPDDPTR